MENRRGPCRPNSGAPSLPQRYPYSQDPSMSKKVHEKYQRSVINALVGQPESSAPGKSKTPKRHQKLMDFVVQPQDFSVPEFHDTYCHMHLPQLVWVSQGFCGEIVEDTFDREQVIWIEAVSRQKRVVAKVEMGSQTKLLSLPVAYMEKLCVITRSLKYVSQEKTLSDIIRDTTLPCLVQFPKDRSIVVSGQKISTNHIPKMELLQCFDEVYLLGNFVTDGVLGKEVIHVPLYLSQLRLAEVIGIRGVSQKKFANYLEELKIAASHNYYDMEFGNAGIAEYDPNAIHSDTMYSYVEPRLYTKFMPMIYRPPVTPQETISAMDNLAFADHPENQDHEYQEIGMERPGRVEPAGFMPKAPPNPYVPIGFTDDLKKTLINVERSPTHPTDYKDDAGYTYLLNCTPKSPSTPSLPKGFKEDLRKKITKERPRTTPEDYKQGASDPHQSKAGPPVPRKPNKTADFTVPSRLRLKPPRRLVFAPITSIQITFNEARFHRWLKPVLPSSCRIVSRP